MKKNTKNNKSNVKRKAVTYVIIGIIAFTMIFSIFSSLIYALQ